MRRALALVLGLCACGPEGHIVAAGASPELSPAALDFGPVLAGEQATREVRVHNPGRTALVLRLEAPPPFRASPARLELQPGASAVASVRFAPDLPGRHEAALAVEGSEAVLALPLLGTAVNPTIEVPAFLDLARVPVRAWTRELLRVGSLAEIPLHVELTLRDPDHAFVMDLDPIELGAGLEVVLLPTFAPPRRGTFEAVLELRTCEGCPPASTILRGQGTVEGLEVSAPVLDFGAVTPGASVRRLLDVTNTGDVPLRVLPGVEGEGFATLEPDLALLPGRTAALPVVFRPQAPHRHQATLQLVAGHEPVVVRVRLDGLGGGPDLRVDPARLDFGLQPLGVPAVRRAHLIDAGAGGLQLVAATIEGPGAAAFALDPLPLPLQVAARPVPFAVRFQPPLEGGFGAELVFTTDDEDLPEVRVPLTGQTLQAPPCDARVLPAELRFGLVRRGGSATREVRVENVGSTPCLLSEVELTPPLGAFQVHRPPSSAFLAPGEVLPLPVTFTPGVRSTRTALLRLRLSDLVRPDREVVLSGTGTDLDLAAGPDPLDFGALPLGLRSSGTVRVEKRDRGTATIVAVRAGGTSGSPFAAALATPLGVDPEHPAHIDVSYLPRVARSDAAQLEVEIAGEEAPLLVDLAGRGEDRPCGVLCADPVASCPDRLDARVNREVVVPGTGWDPAGSAVTCRWSRVQAPQASRAPVQIAHGCNGSFVPDVVGTYELLLQVTDPQAQIALCRTQVHVAAPEEGLWIETFWSHDDDVDLHLLHPDAGDSHRRGAWFSDLDCYYNNAAPDWDVAGHLGDDPSLDRDDTRFTGPENIRIDRPVPGHAYRVGVHWFSDLNRLPHVDVTTRIYCGGELEDEIGVRLGRPGDLVVLGDVTFDPQGTCAVRTDGTLLAP